MTREQIEQRFANGGMSYVEYVDALNALAIEEHLGGRSGKQEVEEMLDTPVVEPTLDDLFDEARTKPE